jgi:hypothetical protein
MGNAVSIDATVKIVFGMTLAVISLIAIVRTAEPTRLYRQPFSMVDGSTIADRAS